MFAHSPEAKGRVERANGTFQDRLVAELRLAGASTLEEANRALWDFLPRFSARFGVLAAQPGSAYRPVEQGMDLDGVLCIKEWRRVAKDNTGQYHGRTLQLYPDLDRPSYARARVEVQERLDGRVVVSYRGRILTPGEAPPLAAALRSSAISPVVLRTCGLPRRKVSGLLVPSHPLALWQENRSGTKTQGRSTYIVTWCGPAWSERGSKANPLDAPKSRHDKDLPTPSPLSWSISIGE